MKTIMLIITLALGLLIATLPAGAQPRVKIPMVGVLSPELSPTAAGALRFVLEAFRQGLHDLGYVEGQTIRLEYRFADWQWDRLPDIAAELVRLQPEVIVTYTSPGAQAAKQATTTIPIVVAATDSMVDEALVASLARPGGNITGLELRGHELTGKRLELLKDAMPTISRIAVLVNPAIPRQNDVPMAYDAEAQALGVSLQRVEAREPGVFDSALAALGQSGAQALMIWDSAMFNGYRHQLLELARRYRLPTMCGGRQYADAGCLVSYSPVHAELFRRAAMYVNKIWKGAKPGDLPVEGPMKFELAINLKTAQALGLTIPPTCSSRPTR
jgi:putative ABC transport system substrate-binding protein